MARYTIRYWLEAAQDLEDAVNWHSARGPGLANRFRQAIRETLNLIRQSPTLWAADAQGVRKVQVKPFSYLIAYSLNEETIEIFAIGHASRDDRFWQARLDRSDAD